MFLAATSSLIVACANTGGGNYAPIEEKTIVDGRVLPKPNHASAEQIATHYGGTNPVVSQLLNAADEHLRQGEPRLAESDLQRALRVDSRNAYIWHFFAQAKLAQEQWSQALEMAKRSSVLASGDASLKEQNRQIQIAALEAQGRFEQADNLRN